MKTLFITVCPCVMLNTPGRVIIEILGAFVVVIVVVLELPLLPPLLPDELLLAAHAPALHVWFAEQVFWS